MELSVFSVKFAFQGLDKFPEEETGTYVAKVWNSEEEKMQKYICHDKIESRWEKMQT